MLWAGNPRVEKPFDIYDSTTDPEVKHNVPDCICPQNIKRFICTVCATAMLRKAFLTKGKVQKNINCNNKSQQVMNWALGREVWAERLKRKEQQKRDNKLPYTK